MACKVLWIEDYASSPQCKLHGIRHWIAMSTCLHAPKLELYMSQEVFIKKLYVYIL